MSDFDDQTEMDRDELHKILQSSVAGSLRSLVVDVIATYLQWLIVALHCRYVGRENVEAIYGNV
jgi:hypothetical protein